MSERNEKQNRKSLIKERGGMLVLPKTKSILIG